MTTPARSVERIAPRRQGNWDWRAAGNFIAGGAGGGLLANATVLAVWLGLDERLPLAAGLVMIGIGLTCVWFEIGRPWRALNVFRHFGSSWMTREAYVALFAMCVGVVAIVYGTLPAVTATGLLGLMFIYAQGRILAANKGIPAWRHPNCLSLVLATGLAEGAGLLALLAWGASWWRYPAALLLLFCLWRLWAWRRYFAALRSDGAPSGTIKAFGDMATMFIWAGNAVPAALVFAAVLMAVPLLVALAGILALAGGWWMKYTLVCRAAFTQGFALPKQPVRGKGQAGPAVKPGWQWSTWLTR
ncbi:MAG: dimethyl sulfoxide reductase anchor subunit [Rhodocyclaceae bacterium]|jgi:phenylacetyl-CoA:acceptor oxidoreductase subunit 2|nr:dimethyl sulfoxide reductase anchor subunit [Rhodocyclaceae bacterium]MBK6555106.1 dimethyl sulfoxide reductase anchor subunit [Rhodocyclaceae bacterium]MBK9309612.1 dimethyl sulfoxide reductase anchor subunit [Rhodocyclaceae bacterium]MBK9955299.1 dimethyl sulfoxide reductase anchor subunit [Rhodocyclaceae bacterium]